VNTGEGAGSWRGGEHLPVQLPQPGPGIGAELVGQPQPDLFVALQRVGLPAAAVQGEEQLARDPLVERVFVGAGRQLGDDVRVPAEAELDVVVVELGGDPLGVQRLAGAQRPRRVQAGERRPPPARERLPQQRRRCLVVAAACLPRESAEPVQVHRILVDDDGISARTPMDLAREQGAQPGQIALQCGDGPRRWVLTPYSGGELIGGDDPIRICQ
jgi:hypothetical protein